MSILDDINAQAAAINSGSSSGSATPKKKRTSKVKLGTGGFASGTGGGGSPNDPISTILDLMSRPLDASTGYWSQGIKNVQSAFHEHPHDVGQALGATIGDVFSPKSPIAAGAKSFVSTNPADHKTSSQLIEQGTDAAGSFDPNYKNTANNVNPWVKGIGGFVGDNALDPLTYVPGVDILSAGRKVLGLAEAGSKLLKPGLSAAEEAEKAVPVAEAAAKAAPAAKSTVLDDLAKAANKPEATGETISAAEKKIAPETVQKAAADDVGKAAVPNADDVPIPPASISPKVPEAGSKMLDWLTKLDPKVAHASAEALNDVGSAQPLEAKNWLREMSQSKDNPVVATLTQGARKRTVRVKDLSGMISGKDANQIELAQAIVAKAHGDYLDKFDAEKSKGNIINALGEPVPTAPVANSVDTFANQLDVFNHHIANNKAAIEQTMGPETIAAMQAAKPAAFNRLTQQMRDTLTGGIDTETPQVLKPATNKMLDQLGMKRPPRPKPKLVTDAPGTPKAPEDVTVPGSIPVPNGTVKTTPEAAADAVAQQSGIDPEMVPKLSKVISDSIHHEYTLKAGWKSGTKTGVLRSDEGWGVGEGNRQREWNTYSQYTLENKARAVVKGEWADLSGRELAEAKLYSMQKIRAAARTALDNFGFPTTMGTGVGRIPLGLDEGFESIDGVDHEAALWAHNGTGSVPPTNLMDALVHSATTAKPSREVIRTMLANTKFPNSDRTFTNNILRGGNLGGERKTASQLLDMYTDAVMKASDDLKERVATNAAAHATRRRAETLMISDDDLKHLNDVVNNGTIGDALDAMVHRKDALSDFQKETNSMDESTEMADHIVEANLPDADKEGAAGAGRTVDKTDEASKEHDKVKPGPKPKKPKTPADEMSDSAIPPAFDDFENGVDETAKDGPPDTTEDFGTTIPRYIAAGVQQKLSPLLTRFSATFGNPTFHGLYRDASTMSRDYMAKLDRDMSKLQRTYKSEELTAAAKAVQQGITPADAKTAAAAEDIGRHLSDLYDISERTGKPSLIGHSWLRTGTNYQHLNDVMGWLGNKATFDYEAAAKAAKENGTSTLEALAEQWRDPELHDIASDPVLYIHKAKQAMLKVHTEHSIAQTFDKMMRDNHHVSNVPRAGYSRVGDSGGSILAKYLSKDKYYDQELLREMHVVDNIMRESTNLTSPVGKFYQKNMEPVTNMWKSGMTIWRPGHHVRNLVGDIGLSVLYGVTNPMYYVKALKILGQKNGYDGYDILRALRSGGVDSIPDGGKAISSVVMRGGRKLDITGNMAYKGMADHGALPNFHTLENLNDDEGVGGIVNAVHAKMAITGGRAKSFVGGVSEARDHFVRAAQFMHFVEHNSTKYSDVNELFRDAAHTVRRWHPDGGTMTTFEAKYMRRIIPFYSWQRAAIPLIVESALTHPGRFMLYPKATYAAAVTQGLDPYSLSDPFPEGSSYPTWLTDQASGPVANVGGNDYTISPGVPQIDVLNQYLGQNPYYSILGQLNPLIKDPIELTTQKNLGIDTDINNTGDYIDSQIPGLSYFTKVTGVSPTNAVTGGKQDKVATPGTGVLNYLTGVGATNISKYAGTG